VSPKKFEKVKMAYIQKKFEFVVCAMSKNTVRGRAWAKLAERETSAKNIRKNSEAKFLKT